MGVREESQGVAFAMWVRQPTEKRHWRADGSTGGANRGVLHAKIAQMIGVCVRSVHRVLRESEGSVMTEQLEERPGRPSKVGAWIQFVKERLKHDPRLPTVELFLLAREAGCRGKKSAFFDMVARLCPAAAPPKEPMGMVDWFPGEASQHDFGQVKVRRFHDLDDLKDQLAVWLDEVNTTRPSRATGEIPAERLRQEAARLRPLAVRPADLAIRIPVTVNPMGFVVHGACRYSMLAKVIAVSGMLYLLRDRVRIALGPYSAEHPRLSMPGQVSTLPEHRAETVSTICAARKSLYYKRQALLDLGPPLYDFQSELVFMHECCWAPHVEEIFTLLVQHGEAPVRAAVHAALGRREFTAKAVHRALVRAGRVLPPMAAARQSGSRSAGGAAASHRTFKSAQSHTAGPTEVGQEFKEVCQ